MRVPLSWLKEYVELHVSDSQLSEILTLAGLEVDKIEKTPFSFEGVIVGEIREVKPHPEADKLKIACVFNGEEIVQVVCGDPSCAAGKKTALAQVGATLKLDQDKPFKIKKSKLRSVESMGMLCSENELGLSEHDETIMYLPETAPTGAHLSDILGDTIVEISLTPNLGHCMSLIGIAREIGALLDQKVTVPKIQPHSYTDPLDLNISIQNPADCYRYSCQMIRNIKVGPSPQWMQHRLENAGIRSVNNIVDITNYVMLELGQPLHAFDYNAIRHKDISIQQTSQPIDCETLDGIKRTLPQGTLVICDQHTPLAVAGVMGGAMSAVQNTTTDILLESAHFNPSIVRKNSKHLGLRSDSSARFERGVDPHMVPLALERATALILEHAGGSPSQPKDVIATPCKERRIVLRTSRVNHILGTQLSQHEIESFLQRLGMDVISNEKGLTVTVPSYRNDIHYEVDLIEEVARIFGYNAIKKGESRVINSHLSHSPLYLLERQARRKLLEMGLQEFLTCDLISPDLAQLCFEYSLGEKNLIHVLKPSSIDQSILRTSLMPGMLHSVKHNFDRQNFNISAFELGHIHFQSQDRYYERYTAALLLTGDHQPQHWSDKPRTFDFFDLKGKVEVLLEGLGIFNAEFKHSQLDSFHTGIQAWIQLGETPLGVIGEIHPDRLQLLDIQSKVFFAQIDLQEILQLTPPIKQLSMLPSYPGSDRDVTFTLKKELPIDAIMKVVQAMRSKLLKDFFLLDLYESETLGTDKKNVTFRFTYRSDHHTVEQKQVEKEHERLISEITKKIRDFIP